MVWRFERIRRERRIHLVLQFCGDCKICGKYASYSESIHDLYCEEFGFDARFCVHCDVWLESNCGDSGCEFCGGRPSRPSEVTNRVRYRSLDIERPEDSDFDDPAIDEPDDDEDDDD